VAYTSEFPPVYVTVDAVLLTIRDEQLQVLMVRRGSRPFNGWVALPGGFVRPSEDLPDGARRELREETGLSLEPAHLEQLGTFGAPRRDPRARTVSVAYLAVLPSLPQPTAGTDAVAAGWHPVTDMLSRRLPFDHHDILSTGVERARSKLEYTTLATAFVGATFTIADLRRVYEITWGRALDPGNFHRKVLGSEGFVRRVAGERSGSRGRPAALYQRGEAALLNPPILR
jgi:8-oxo-dGTP diphosphatase